MNIILTFILCLCLIGCATTGDGEKQTFRQSVGRPIAHAGQAVGKTGTIIIMTAGVSIVLLPLALVGIPFYVIAIPVYYGGNAIAGDEAETKPFEL